MSDDEDFPLLPRYRKRDESAKDEPRRRRGRSPPPSSSKGRLRESGGRRRQGGGTGVLPRLVCACLVLHAVYAGVLLSGRSIVLSRRRYSADAAATTSAKLQAQLNATRGALKALVRPGGGSANAGDTPTFAALRKYLIYIHRDGAAEMGEDDLRNNAIVGLSSLFVEVPVLQALKNPQLAKFSSWMFMTALEKLLIALGKLDASKASPSSSVLGTMGQLVIEELARTAPGVQAASIEAIAGLSAKNLEALAERWLNHVGEKKAFSAFYKAITGLPYTANLQDPEWDKVPIHAAIRRFCLAISRTDCMRMGHEDLRNTMIVELHMRGFMCEGPYDTLSPHCKTKLHKLQGAPDEKLTMLGAFFRVPPLARVLYAATTAHGGSNDDDNGESPSFGFAEMNATLQNASLVHAPSPWWTRGVRSLASAASAHYRSNLWVKRYRTVNASNWLATRAQRELDAPFGPGSPQRKQLLRLEELVLNVTDQAAAFLAYETVAFPTVVKDDAEGGKGGGRSGAHTWQHYFRKLLMSKEDLSLPDVLALDARALRQRVHSTLHLHYGLRIDRLRQLRTLRIALVIRFLLLQDASPLDSFLFTERQHSPQLSRAAVRSRAIITLHAKKLRHLNGERWSFGELRALQPAMLRKLAVQASKKWLRTMMQGPKSKRGSRR